MKNRFGIVLGVVVVAVLIGVLLRVRSTPLYRGKSVAAWALLSVAPEAGSREEAAAAFNALGTNALPGLIQLLEYQDPFWRRKLWTVAPQLPSRLRQFTLRMTGVPRAPQLHVATARCLGALGSQAQPAIPALVRLLYGAEPQARYTAALTLGLIGQPAVPVLTVALDHRDRDVRYVALCALSSARPTDLEAAMPALVRTAADSDEGVRDAAITTFRKLGLAVLPAVTNALASGDQPTRRGAAMALSSLGAPRPLAAAPLLELAKDNDPASRLRALQSLSRLGVPDEATIQTYILALADADSEVRLAAIYGLNQCRGRAAPAVPALLKCLTDTSPKIREWGARVLGAAGDVAVAAPAVARLVDDPEARVRMAAQEALAALESRSRDLPASDAP